MSSKEREIEYQTDRHWIEAIRVVREKYKDDLGVFLITAEVLAMRSKLALDAERKGEACSG